MAFEALVVDDDRDPLEHVCAVLAALEGRVTTASTRLYAITQLRDNAFDFVVLKTDLPDMDGRHTMTQIRGSALASAHAIFITVAPELQLAKSRPTSAQPSSPPFRGLLRAEGYANSCTRRDWRNVRSAQHRRARRY
jgi:CheY-like chemotaxis protein